MFSDDLSEFDSAREIVSTLSEEYKASEKSDYVEWGAKMAAEAARAKERDLDRRDPASLASANA